MARQPPTARAEIVDWEAVDEEIRSVPAEYREFRFYPLKHVVELFSANDPQGLTQEVGGVEQRQMQIPTCACAP